MKISKRTHSTGIILIFIGTVLALITIVVIEPFSVINIDKLDTKNIIELTNKQRSLQDKKALTTNSDLVNAAQKRAEDLAKQLQLSNYKPNELSAWGYFKDVNYPYQIAGENIAIGGYTNKAVVDSWMQSVTHKSNVINSSFSDIGVGVASYYSTKNSQNYNVTVALFATQTNTGLTSGSEATYPAGPINITDSSNNLIARLLLVVAFALIILGAFLEYLQIKRHHHLQDHTVKINSKNI